MRRPASNYSFLLVILSLVQLMRPVSGQSGGRGSNIPCAEVDLQDQHNSLSYARLTGRCPLNQFCCYPVTGGSKRATCCDDCSREIDFNPMVQPGNCLSSQREWSMVVIILLPVLTALFPGMVAVTAVLVLSMVGRNRDSA